MTKKRKRPNRHPPIASKPLSLNPRTTTNNNPTHPVISLYYPHVLTLRQYLLRQLPVFSKLRRRRIASFSVATATKDEDHRWSAHVPDLVQLLDTTLVGVLHESPPTISQERRRDLAAFTESQTQSGSQLGSTSGQSEIVEYVIATLFNRNGYQRPQHLLAHGFQRFMAPRANDPQAMTNIPGIMVQYPNKNVQTLQQVPWTDVLDLLGSNGEEIMLKLLLDCGIFPCIDHRKGIFYQLSGLPLPMLEPLDKTGPGPDQPPSKFIPPPLQGLQSRPGNKNQDTREEAQVKPNSIIFLRRRAFYARPNLNAKGQVRFGLNHDHALNRLFSANSLVQTMHLMQHIFPRQFGLTNVFTSTDTREQAQSFNNSFGHQSIQNKYLGQSEDGQNEVRKIPKRLRGKPVELVQRLQNRHKHCSYAELLRYYCSSEATGPWKLGPASSQSDSDTSHESTPQTLVTQAQFPQSSSQSLDKLPLEETGFKAPVLPQPSVTLTDYATPASSVSAFCRAVLRKLIPPLFFGTGHHGLSNQRAIFKQVDRFIRMRRFESLNLHEVCQGIKITSIPWLEPPKLTSESSRCKLSQSDSQKRTELLHEFIYYLFDSILIPLIRTHFYVTESQTHRNRLFFFRHDVWRRLTEQPLTTLKSNVFEELKPEMAQKVLGRRSLGYSFLRLLPKSTGVRPIMNLRRRAWVKCNWPGKQGSYLGASINSTVTPIHNMLNYEKARGPSALGSALLSVGDLHPKLRSFKDHLLKQHGGSLPTLYFVKVDIQSCFDTIPQQKLIRLIEELVSEEAYHITKHVELRPSDEFSGVWLSEEPTRSSKPQRKYVGRAAPASKPQSVPDAFTGGVTSRRRNTVFVDTLAQREHHSEDLLDLLDEHVRNNLIRIGKKYFRQRNGIPQGSMLSSLLCNYFYAELEREMLGFLHSDQALLLRLVDDFLLVTTDVDMAMRFLHVLVRGQPAYGVSVHPAKSLVNFAAAVDGIQIPRLVGSTRFPYCGNLIDTHTLEIYRDQDRVLEGGDTAAETLSNALTVESARAPGRSLHRKVLAGFKLQMHPMYLDTQHNSRNAVVLNLYTNFVTSAMKMYRYLKCLQGRAHPSPPVIIRTIQDLTQLAQRLARSRRGEQSETLSTNTQWVAAPISDVPPSQVQYLAASAFRFVLGRKQTRYAVVLRWLDSVCKTTRPKADGTAVRIGQVLRQGNSTFGEWRF